MAGFEGKPPVRSPFPGPITDDRGLMRAVLARDHELLTGDEAQHSNALTNGIRGARVLVTGAAGSIGSAVSRRIASFRPATLVLVDPNENSLVELLRELRSGLDPLPTSLQTLSIEMGSPGFRRYLQSVPQFDYLLNFAALKHVRAERDPFTLMRMLDTNVLALARTMAVLDRMDAGTRVFSVSSDKAVNPSSLMGASKALMEALLWHQLERRPSSSARFANVAFSRGSLLDGFGHRLRKGQPLSAPSDIRRYFITHDEAARMCLLACFVCSPGQLLVPRLDASQHLVSLADVAIAVLGAHGLVPRLASSEHEARRWAAGRASDATDWPCYFGASDTSGEKPYEELTHPREATCTRDFADATTVEAARFPLANVAQALPAIEALSTETTWDPESIASVIVDAVPTLSHRPAARSLDDKM